MPPIAGLLQIFSKHITTADGPIWCVCVCVCVSGTKTKVNKMIIKHRKGCILWQTSSLPEALLVQCFSAFTESALTSSLIVLFGSTNLKKQDEIESSKWLKGSLDESYIATSKMRADKTFWPLTFCPQHLPAIPRRDEIRDNRDNRNRTVSFCSWWGKWFSKSNS